MKSEKSAVSAVSAPAPRPMQPQIDMRAREAAMFELIGRKDFENAVLKGEVTRLQGIAQQLQAKLSAQEEADKKAKAETATSVVPPVGK